MTNASRTRTHARKTSKNSTALKHEQKSSPAPEKSANDQRLARARVVCGNYPIKADSRAVVGL